MAYRFIPFFLVTLAAAVPANAERIELSGVLINVLEEAKVPARQEGVLQTVTVQEGELVQQDQVLAQVDNTEAQLGLERAKLELNIARLNSKSGFDLRTAQEEHRLAANNLRRANASRKKFELSISPADFDRYEVEHNRTAIDIERAKLEQDISALLESVRANEVAKSQRELERHRVVAPFDGMVVEVKRRRGEWVQPGDQVLRILRVDRLRADGYLPAAQATPQLKGAAVTLTIPGPRGSQSFTGKVVFVSPEINPVDGKVRVWAAIDNRGLVLKPGMNGTLAIKTP